MARVGSVIEWAYWWLDNFWTILVVGAFVLLPLDMMIVVWFIRRHKNLQE